MNESSEYSVVLDRFLSRYFSRVAETLKKMKSLANRRVRVDWNMLIYPIVTARVDAVIVSVYI